MNNLEKVAAIAVSTLLMAGCAPLNRTASASKEVPVSDSSELLRVFRHRLHVFFHQTEFLMLDRTVLDKRVECSENYFLGKACVLVTPPTRGAGSVPSYTNEDDRNLLYSYSPQSQGYVDGDPELTLQLQESNSNGERHLLQATVPQDPENDRCILETMEFDPTGRNPRKEKYEYLRGKNAQECRRMVDEGEQRLRALILITAQKKYRQVR